MVFTILARLTIGSMVGALAVLIVTSGSPLAQSVTPSKGGKMDMTPAATSQPQSGAASGAMGRMMQECQSMMGIMGGGMMASPEAGPENSATPSP